MASLTVLVASIGELVAVTGSPPGLTVAPLGGAMRVASGSRTPTAIGPPQADLTSVAIGGDASVYLAGAEGVFAVAPAGGVTGTGVPQLLADGWPGGGSAGVVVAGATVLAGSNSGVQQLSGDGGTAWSTPPARAVRSSASRETEPASSPPSPTGGSCRPSRPPQRRSRGASSRT